MDYNKLALEMHEQNKGKIAVRSKVTVKTRDDLSTAYTPGVAEPCRKIRDNKEEVYRYTAKGNLVAVVSDGTAVLGLGDIGPEAAMPVMEGKALLFKEFADIDAFPICLDTAEMVSTMADDAIIFAMANPTPEIMPDEAKKGGARVIATGRSDFPNQINNVLVFPGIFRGALDARAGQITEEMKMAAARAIASIISDDELNEEYIIPGAFDERVCKAVAKAVAEESQK